MASDRQHLSFTEIKALPTEQEQVTELRAYLKRMDAAGVNTQVVRKARKRLSLLTKIAPETAPSESHGKVSAKRGKSQAKLERERKISRKGKRAQNAS